MLKKALNLWFILPTTLLILLVIWLLLAPHPGIVISEEQQRIPTPIGATSNPTPVAPVATPDEQQRLMQRLRMVPEDAKVQMGQMQLASASETTQSARYTTRTDMVQGKQALFVKDTTTGQELRFGNAQGHAFFVALSDAYLMWSFQCSQCDETASVKTAVYASNLGTSEQVVVAEGVSRTEGKIDNEWIVYVLFHDAEHGALYAYNLLSRATSVVTDTFSFGNAASSPFCCTVTPSMRYTIHNNKVLWSDEGIHIYDLIRQTRTSLALPPVATAWAQRIDSSDATIVWQTGAGWWGYDLSGAQLFPISIVPPGWEYLKASFAAPVTISDDDHLFWTIKVNEQEYLFTASINRST